MADERPITEPVEAGGGSGEPPTLPRVATSLSDDEVRERLARLSRRGKLPGYEGAPGERGAGGAGSDVLFTVTDFGFPFESRLFARRNSEAIVFDVRLKPLMPWVFAALLAATVWPGVWFTESMLETYLPGTWVTRWVWWWYLAMTAPFVPWAMWAAVVKSRRSGRAEAARLIERIGEELGTAGP